MKTKAEIDALVGANVKRERERAGYTQDQFSEMIGIGSKSLSALERGTVGVSITTLRKICTLLSVSANTLLFENTHENDVQDLVEKLNHLTPEQFEIARDIMNKIIQAFALQSNDKT